MRPNLFGANMAAKIARGLGKHMLLGYLTRPIAGTRDPAALTAGNSSGAASASWAFRGMVEPEDEEIDGTLTRASKRKITILGGTLPDDVDPQPNDIITIEGAAWRIDGSLGGVERDPAGATFTCHCSGTNIPSVSAARFAVTATALFVPAS